MKFIYLIVAVLFCCHAIYSQEEVVIPEVDSLYKEDQFYIGVTYNLLGNMPKNVSQNGFSSGFHLGYIKDMPINARRNISIGVGIGYSGNSLNQNILIDKDASEDYTYIILNDSDIGYTKNKFALHLVEFPIEFRWRTSTATDYKFWRIYTGFKIGYVIANTTKFRGDLGTLKYSDVKDFNDFQYGLTFSAGYNTWNFYLQYNLNTIFSNDAQLNGSSIDMKSIKIGLIFYMF